MKKLFLALLFLLPVCIYPNDINVSATQHARMNVCLGIIGKKSHDIKQMAERIKKDLEFSGQFQVDVRMCGRKPSHKEVTKIARDGYPLVIFFNYGKRNTFEWRLYDTTQSIMLAGQTYTKRGNNWRGWAHNIADALWPQLTGEQSFFASKLAYCKETHAHNGKRLTQICVADFDGSHEQLLINTPTVNVAPRWNGDTRKPMLFYSEYTNDNVRMIVSDMHGRRKVTSNFEGINMLPAFSADGSEVIYCASKGGGSCQLYHYSKSGLKQLTNNDGNNISPCLGSDGKLFFCSDFKTHSPQIYSLDMQTGDTKQITPGGYCASPSYCAKNKKLAYGRMTRGSMQIFEYDLKTKKHRQLTKTAGNKEECSWSPCGNYLAFSVERGNKSQIVMLNMLTNTTHYLTSGNDKYSYPIWSPLYERYPEIQV